MVVVEAGTGKILETLPIGAHSDAAAFDPGTNAAFSSNRDGTLTVITPSTPAPYQVAQTVQTLPTARTMAFDPETHQIYLVAAETDGISPPTDSRPFPHPHIKPNSFMVLTAEMEAFP